MERRRYVTMITTVGVSAFSGCGAIETVIRGDNENQEEIERVKTNAESPKWDELLRHMDEWDGEPVHYPAVRRESLSEMNNGSYVITVGHPEYSSPSTESLHCDWFGDRDELTENMDIWGTVEGTHTYSFGEEKTVPDIHLVEVQPSE
jgi:Rieske Fe-S protein